MTLDPLDSLTPAQEVQRDTDLQTEATQLPSGWWFLGMVGLAVVMTLLIVAFGMGPPRWRRRPRPKLFAWW